MDTAKLRARALLGCPLTDYERAFFLLFVAEEWESEIFLQYAKSS